MTKTIEAVVVTANERAFLAMRGTDAGTFGELACLDGATDDFSAEWSEFRDSLNAGKGDHHVIASPGEGTHQPRMNVVEVDSGDGGKSVWIARDFQEIGAAQAGDASVRLVTDKAKAIALAQKGTMATAGQADIDDAAAPLTADLAVSFMEPTHRPNPMSAHTAYEAFGDLEITEV